MAVIMNWLSCGMPIHYTGKVRYKYTTPKRRAWSPFSEEKFTIPAGHHIVVEYNNQYVTMSVSESEYIKCKYNDDYEYNM